MTTVLVIGVDASGSTGAYFVPFSGESFYPTVGARCRLNHSKGQPDLVGGGMQLAPSVQYPVVSTFECDATSKVDAF
ncbi:hypothetical protein D3C80_2025250 [compost metagenome]